MTHRSEALGTPGTLPWLETIMRRLLAPDGCPWDREQTLASLKPFLLEECYEVLDAIDEGDGDHHTEELGDLLFQIVFQAELAGRSLEEVIRGIGEKLIRRHPHVFGETRVRDTEEVLANWERLKAEERTSPRPTLAGVPRAMPALQRAYELSRKAAKAGFEWPDAGAARRKVDEELGEVDAALAAGDADEVRAELGDLLFAVAVWGRKLGVEPEEALREAGARYERRFTRMEAELGAEGKAMQSCSLDELLARWARAKGGPAV